MQPSLRAQRSYIRAIGGGEYEFVTNFTFDSWGRIQEIVYPDKEHVAYSYAIGGELEKVESTSQFNDPNSQLDYVSKIGYDGYGSQKYMLYGNEVVTELDYSTKNRSLINSSITTPTRINSPATVILDKDFKYFSNGKISEIKNNSQGYNTTWNTLGDDYENKYFYDYAHRLRKAEHNFNNGQKEYELDLTYHRDGRMLTKEQKNLANGTGYTDDTEYRLNYTYKSGKKHQVEQILGSNGYNATFDYGTYTPRGAVSEITVSNTTKHYNQQYIWDEVDRLRAVNNENGVQHNVYDANGNRIMKGQAVPTSAAQNGEARGALTAVLPYIVYVNPYMVCTFYDDALDISKHYYTGSKRVASNLYVGQHSLSTTTGGDPEDPEEPEANNNNLPSNANPLFYQTPVSNTIVLEDLIDILGMIGETGLSLGSITSAGLQNYLHQENLIEYAPCDVLDEEVPPSFPEDMSIGEYNDCICRFYPDWAETLNINCNVFHEVYWYHPDYLGNTEFVTDIGGYPYQFLYYSAFGEVLEGQHASTGNYNTPYRFNAKELDSETGLYYYGARYYNPMTSTWLSVDAMANKYPNSSPYVFTANNPVMLIDPDGNTWEEASEAMAKEMSALFNRAETTYQNKADRLNKRANRKLAKGKTEKSNKLNKRADDAQAAAFEMSDGQCEIEQMGDSETNFAFKKNDFGGENLTTMREDGTVEIEYSVMQKTSSAAHELVHGYQHLTGEIELKAGQGGGSYADLGDELNAYRRQFAIRPNSIKLLKSDSYVKRISDLSKEWVSGIVSKNEKPYKNLNSKDDRK